MELVSDEDLRWIQGTPVNKTIRSAIPAGYDVYGLLDLADDNGLTEKRLLAALWPPPGEPLVAGWIERNSLLTETGDVHLLYANWRYRCRSIAPEELTGRPSQQAGEFPDLLFPPDHSWIVSTLWDDTWRSLGVTESTASDLEKLLPTFERIAPETDIAHTGREVY